MVTKATEDNPENRFENIVELEKHFNALRDLQLNQNIPIEYITLSEVLSSGEKMDYLKMHQILVKGNYIDHVYDDYIAAVNKFVLLEDGFDDYYGAIGMSVREFVRIYSERLNDCYATFRWPFSAMGTFGKVLKKIIYTVNDDEVRLICLKQIWHIAFEADQWSVQDIARELYTNAFISKAIENELAEHIISSGTRVEMSKFSRAVMPTAIKSAVIAGNRMADRRLEESAKERDDLYKNF